MPQGLSFSSLNIEYIYWRCGPRARILVYTAAVLRTSNVGYTERKYTEPFSPVPRGGVGWGLWGQAMTEITEWRKPSTMYLHVA